MKIEEKNIEKDISEERKLEMDKYGRTKTYSEISTFLDGDKRLAYGTPQESGDFDTMAGVEIPETQQNDERDFRISIHDKL